MGRHPRVDQPGSWHHVTNRGIARRTLFENKGDIRYFLAQLARAVRRGQLEVHAWCVLTTHFHLLVRSPAGELSNAMRRVQNTYVRSFNRGRKRDGPLVRGRFLSKPVLSLAYRILLVGYIDANPVQAGLAATPWAYPWGSAQAYAKLAGPPWLMREWVESAACDRLRAERYDASLYPRAFPSTGGQTIHRLVDARLARSGGVGDADPLDDLLDSAPERVLDWMRRKARLADATSPGEPIADPLTVHDCLRVARDEHPNWSIRIERRARSGWDLLEVGLLRDLTASTMPQIAARTSRNAVAAARLYREHASLLEADECYAARAAECAVACFAELSTHLRFVGGAGR